MYTGEGTADSRDPAVAPARVTAAHAQAFATIAKNAVADDSPSAQLAVAAAIDAAQFAATAASDARDAASTAIDHESAVALADAAAAAALAASAAASAGMHTTDPDLSDCVGPTADSGQMYHRRVYNCRNDCRNCRNDCRNCRITVGLHVGLLSDYCRTLSDAVGRCRTTVGPLSDYCRNLLSDCRTRALAGRPG